MKSPLASKTIWANIAVIVVSVLAGLQNQELIANNAVAVAVLGVLIGVGNVLLRFVTNKPVK